jgi:hypothetical protein
MRVKGLPGDEKWKLRPEVDVELWELSPIGNECSYYDVFEVSDLTDDWLNNYNENWDEDKTWNDFGLRPVELDGDEYFSMPLEEAYTDEWTSLIPFHNRLS